MKLEEFVFGNVLVETGIFLVILLGILGVGLIVFVDNVYYFVVVVVVIFVVFGYFFSCVILFVFVSVFYFEFCW